MTELQAQGDRPRGVSRPPFPAALGKMAAEAALLEKVKGMNSFLNSLRENNQASLFADAAEAQKDGKPLSHI